MSANQKMFKATIEIINQINFKIQNPVGIEEINKFKKIFDDKEAKIEKDKKEGKK